MCWYIYIRNISFSLTKTAKENKLFSQWWHVPQTGKKNTSAVWQAFSSRHHKGPIESPPYAPRYHRVVYVRGISGGSSLSGGSRIPSLSDSCTPDLSIFSKALRSVEVSLNWWNLFDIYFLFIDILFYPIFLKGLLRNMTLILSLLYYYTLIFYIITH